MLIGMILRYYSNVRMFDIIFSKIWEDPLLRLPSQKEYKEIMVLVTPYLPGSDDLTTLSYYLDLLLEIFRFGNQNLRAVCADDRAVLDPSRLELLEKSILLGDRPNVDGLTSTDMTYAVLLLRICLRYVLYLLSDAVEHFLWNSRAKLIQYIPHNCDTFISYLSVY